MSAKEKPVADAGESVTAATAEETAAAVNEPAHPSVAEIIEANPDTPEIIVDLLRVSERLTALMEREIDMIREMDPAEMKALHDGKAGLAAAYEARLRNVSEDPSLLDTLNDEVRGALRSLTERFAETLNRNERSLHAARQATDAMLRTVVNAVAKQQREKAGYSPRGNHAAPSGAPISLDQRF